MKYLIELFASDELGRTITYSVSSVDLPTEVGGKYSITTARTQDNDSEGDPDNLSVRARVHLTAVA